MFDQLGEGVFRRRYESLNLNIGVVIGDDGVLLIDTRASYRQARQLSDELRSLTKLPVRWVVNTHWHWDHTFGNAPFEPAEIWAHELCGVALSQHGEQMKQVAEKWLGAAAHDEIEEVRVVPPNQVFSNRASVDIGREVLLTYHGPAHTDADIVVRVVDGNVAFFGDLVEEGAPPSFDDSFPVLWPLTLRLASDEFPYVIVPGHGDVVSPRFVRDQHAELAAVAELAASVIDGATALDGAAVNGPYPEDVMRNALLRAEAAT